MLKYHIIWVMKKVSIWLLFSVCDMKEGWSQSIFTCTETWHGLICTLVDFIFSRNNYLNIILILEMKKKSPFFSSKNHIFQLANMRNSQLALFNSQIPTRILQLALFNSQLATRKINSQFATRNSHFSTRNSQNQLADWNSQLALFNSQLATRKINSHYPTRNSQISTRNS